MPCESTRIVPSFELAAVLTSPPEELVEDSEAAGAAEGADEEPPEDELLPQAESSRETASRAAID
jgi:hypothetical protein